MSNDEQNFQDNLGNLLNQKWGELLGQKLIETEQLKFQYNREIETNRDANETIEDLRAGLHQAQIDLLKAQGKAAINKSDTDVDKQ